MKKYWWVFTLAAPMFAVFLAGIRVYYSIGIWTYSGPDIVFEIKPGEGFSKINGRLSSKGIINSSRIFHRYAQVTKIMTKFKAGQYEIPSKTNMLGVIDILTSGQSITTSITIPEGKNLFEIAALLEKKGITKKDEFIALAKSPEMAKSLNIPGERVEGYLYPDTYRFTPDSEAKIVISTMVKLFRRKLKELPIESAPLDLNPHEVVILASVVEKETGVGHERPMIAGVFFNRLRKRMRLQSDPTTIYGIWENFNGNLRKKHLLEKTPYNTYKIPALPKGPISNPGTESLKAVLNPASHKFLYFVSQNDGTHVFSENYKKHLEAVNKYQKDYRARKGKSWRDYSKKKEAKQ